MAIVASPGRVHAGNFCASVVAGDVHAPKRVAEFAAEYGITTARELVAFVRSSPRVVAAHFGWTFDQAVFSADGLADDLAELLDAETLRGPAPAFRAKRLFPIYAGAYDGKAPPRVVRTRRRGDAPQVSHQNKETKHGRSDRSDGLDVRPRRFSYPF